jgi:hypothetical protein
VRAIPQYRDNIRQKIVDIRGWKTLSMVQRYAHLSPSHEKNAIERLVTRQRPVDLLAQAGAESHQDSRRQYAPIALGIAKRL